MTALRNDSTIGASWMEHQILHHVKQALRTTLDWKAPAVSLPRKHSSVCFTLKSFQRHLERLMKLEEEDGYMSVVSEAKPNLQHQIDQLALDHDRFRRQVRTLVPRLEELHEWQQADFEQVFDEIRRLLDEVDRHDEQEIELLQESLLFDEGGEG